MKNITDVTKQHADTGENLIDLIADNEVHQFIARENYKKPGQPIFIQDDGKVGFPSINGLNVNIGDTVKGVVHHSQENYFFVEVQEIVKAAPVKK